jgi:hypothetical protein
MADLTGSWLGTYWQDGAPTRFEATLVQGGNSLSGRIADDGRLGEAQVSGEVIGRRVAFTKKYLAGKGAVKPIDYDGTVSEDGNFIQGSWVIAGEKADTGNWEARRNEEGLMAEWRSQLEKSLDFAGSRR